MSNNKKVLHAAGLRALHGNPYMGHVRSESQSVQYVPFDIWTSCTQYKHIKIKVHSFKYGTSVREK